MRDEENVPVSSLIPHPSSFIPEFMEPEIARRCPKCGASVRGSAFFCPQCGTPVKAAAAGAVHSATEGVEKSDHRQTDGGGSSAIAAAAPPASPEMSSGVESSKEVFTPEAQGEAHAPLSVTAPRVEEAERHWKRHRISSAREAVGEKIAPRMEKLRQASNVMLDEAAYDPSLRFVLVAVVILVLTLLLFILHGLIG
jgi:hypothetical protein